MFRISMKRQIINTKTFPKTFSRWCVCGGLLLAILDILICYEVIPAYIINSNNFLYQLHMLVDRTFKRAVATVCSNLEMLYLIAICGSIFILVRQIRQNPKWMRSSIITLVLVIYFLIRTLSVCLKYLNLVGWDWNILNKPYIIGALAFIILLVMWFTGWLAALSMYIYNNFKHHTTSLAEVKSKTK